MLARKLFCYILSIVRWLPQFVSLFFLLTSYFSALVCVEQSFSHRAITSHLLPQHVFPCIRCVYVLCINALNERSTRNLLFYMLFRAYNFYKYTFRYIHENILPPCHAEQLLHNHNIVPSTIIPENSTFYRII